MFAPISIKTLLGFSWLLNMRAPVFRNYAKSKYSVQSNRLSAAEI